MLPFVLLGFLSYRPMFGYELKDLMDASTRHFWHAKLSQIYMCLKDLEKSGRVTAHQEVGEKGPARKRYSITDEGRKDLLAWLMRSASEPEAVKSPFLVRIFFSGLRGPRKTRDELLAFRRETEVALEALRGETRDLIEMASGTHPDLERDSFYWEIVRRMGELHHEAVLKWCHEVEVLLKRRMEEGRDPMEAEK